LLDDLYRDILLDHYRNPRHRRHLESPNHEADGANPLCGDQIHVEASVDGDRALAAVGVFQQMMITGEQPPADMGDIEALAGVAKFPVRVKCASLAWKTLEQALMTPTDTVSAGPVTTDDGKE
jgi:nitrogen fixation NifU-like protein